MDNIIRVNPASNAFRNFRKTAELNPACREPLAVEQQEIFIDYIYASEKYSRMANLFTVLLGTGMRIGEALGLRWCDCDFEEGIIHVMHALLYKQGEDGNCRYRISAYESRADSVWHPPLPGIGSQKFADRPFKTPQPYSLNGFRVFVV